MKLKCIGGLSNGQIIEVESYYGENDIVRVIAKVEFKIIDLLDTGKIPEFETIPYHYYKISVLHFPNKVILKYLIPENWKAEQALAFALGA